MTTPLVRIQDLVKRYPNGVEALRGVSLDLHPGETTVVLGPSGAGKSTLLRSINGLETPTSGRVWVGQTPVERASLREVRQRVGMVFQQFNLVPRLSVMANVLSGRLGRRGFWTNLTFAFPAEDYDLAYKAIADVGLVGREWDRVDKLSGGQQQRVAIARTVVQQPEVILADEPVASLDPATSREIMELLVQMAAQNRGGLVLNLHQIEVAREFGDRIIGIQKGQVAFDERTTGLSDRLLADLYGETLCSVR